MTNNKSKKSTCAKKKDVNATTKSHMITHWFTPTGRSNDIVPVTEEKKVRIDDPADITLNQPSFATPATYDTPTQDSHFDDSSGYSGDETPKTKHEPQKQVWGVPLLKYDDVEVVEMPEFFGITCGLPMNARAVAAPTYECGGCGNHKTLCLEVKCGPYLCHVMWSIYDRHHPHEVTDETIENAFQEKFQDLLRIRSYDKLFKYDEKRSYSLPKCIVEGSLKYSKAIVHARRTIGILSMRRAYGVADELFTFKTLEDEEDELK